ncbi:uncharacterized protein LACBIDRAFT_305963 [Laccaria bicolor S238N-H82]|uniref:Predicted protein n=1 Tax=Laccaria bicolor (strain S238N-H82 / ATCC MYA-4686) TaxID=486041 RepID=B0CSD1_LACBS|nr:uncharacterized protein LACBIDRAFT_305963 [Laccaria bicolor S238N-H82]EDR14823.1 predicted protein [Laccaria bicolor S238N-H82]|eukprot:XP_001875382.1 predicted protein [Laccaria bicolor S238N-H82]
MCHNLIDGRYHTECRHFSPMATNFKDCQKPNCLFSRWHAHPTGCRSTHCIRLMSPPVQNPIRMVQKICTECSKMEREGRRVHC